MSNSKNRQLLLKASICQKLLANVGDVERTNDEVYVGRSTLYEWKSALKKNGANVTLKPAHPDPRSAMIATRYSHIHDSLMTMIEDMMGNYHRLTDVNEQAKMILALARLIDRLERVQNSITNYSSYTLTVDFLHPDGEKRAFPFNYNDYTITKK